MYYSRLIHFEHVFSEFIAEKKIHINESIYQKVIDRYILCSDKFDELCKLNVFGGRKNFLNFRFVAWRLLQEYGIYVDYIPF